MNSTNFPEYLTKIYRLYPSEAQIKKLNDWNDGLRYLWNLAHSQYLLKGMRTKDDRTKVECNFYSQSEELTELRKEKPFLNNIPRVTASDLLDRLSISWKRFWEVPDTGKPKFKKKGRDFIGIECKDNRAFKLDNKRKLFKLTKLGEMRVVIDTPLPGKAMTCIITRDIDQWYVHIVYKHFTLESDTFEGPKPATGVDRGKINQIADSNGNLHPTPKLSKYKEDKLARLQRKLERQRKGSKNQTKTKDTIAKIYRKDRRQRYHQTHVLTSYLAKNHSLIGIEDLKTQEMASIGGKLGHGINRACWSQIEYQLDYKSKLYGSQVIRVNPAYTSQMCLECHHIDPKNRDGEMFCCLKCGHQDHADLNAAKNIKERAIESWLKSEKPIKKDSRRTNRSVLPGEAHKSGSSEESGDSEDQTVRDSGAGGYPPAGSSRENQETSNLVEL